MRRYETDEGNRLIQVRCNQCGKELKVENGYLKEGCFHGDVCFGYFSQKDGSRQQFDLCEECYDRLVLDFTVPVTRTEENELL